jgi:hypothetical protein
MGGVVGAVAVPFWVRKEPVVLVSLAPSNTLKNASLEAADHKDDDWIVLDYDGPDSAISPYRGRKP